jgi:hypothetical protein
MLASFLAGVDATGWRREQLATDPAGMTIHRLRLEEGTAVPRVPASRQVRPRA